MAADLRHPLEMRIDGRFMGAVSCKLDLSFDSAT
jgi:hypothetical protein